MTDSIATTKKIQGNPKTVRELLQTAKYSIDFYQREYSWEERQVRELIDDLTGKFFDSYSADHERHEVETYSHYFLGPIVVSHKRGQRFIVDGQQRLTTLTLLLVYLHHLQADRDETVDIKSLVYSEKYGRKSFNLNVPDRERVMTILLEGSPTDSGTYNDSSRNILNRYANIVDYFPEEETERALPFFIDWLLDNVNFVEIEAFSDEDAYTIFETMNDRGLSLSLPDMLKAYVLANVSHEEDQKKLNSLWKDHMQRLKDLGNELVVDFFKNWLRAQHAETFRQGKRGAENQDYERVGTEFHRWVRDQRDKLNLNDADSYIRFVNRDMDFFASIAVKIELAARKLSKEWESIRFIEHRGFTLQHQVLLASIKPNDDKPEIDKKIALVADFLDIWLARRVWNFKTVSYSSVRYTIFNITKDLRGRNIQSLSEYLLSQLDEQQQKFETQPQFRLHQQNKRQVRHILARITSWLEASCGAPFHYEDYVASGGKRPFEIEHIWEDQFDRFKNEFSHPFDFDAARNRIGGLVLLPQGINQSLTDKPYVEKLGAYAANSENLLAQSLHPLVYKNNPKFKSLIEKSGLPFRSYDVFGPEEQAERQELYTRLAELVWNPDRLVVNQETRVNSEAIVSPQT